MVKQEKESQDINESLKTLAPGTSLREGLESILRAKTGALIVVGDDLEIIKMVDGGFYINTELTPAHLYELAKMDGAIIISSDQKKILNANTQLNPDPSIPSSETGIRHRTAQRVARQTGNLVVSISQRRNIITIYKGWEKYILQDTNKVLNKANQAIQTLEKYKAVLEQAMTSLSALELEDLVTLYDVCLVIQRTEMVMRIANEIERYINELGSEGRLVSMQLEELIAFVKEDGENIIEDYKIGIDNNKDSIMRSFRNFTSEELLDLTNIAMLLGYSNDINILDMPVMPRGYRILFRIPRLPAVVIKNLVKRFNNFQKILRASTEELYDVEGIGEVRAKNIKEGLRRVRDQVLLDRHLLKK
ncbi:DNA integrity scanning diadenylate cyclase DisA [Maledivibacter halophilus]|uniref:DNA integrity scanning protein DisA n=1 Tax=Maledivibacter halophilus TaxID=36842 RepID=A0A1T5MIP5_9FIRM|nr:DNA integrity scanning diadenylate cyclase DisA [Maledivibacter halophilus]SKC87943.1 diadenylate cyclase [Maledivibacter halophilus]